MARTIPRLPKHTLQPAEGTVEGCRVEGGRVEGGRVGRGEAFAVV